MKKHATKIGIVAVIVLGIFLIGYSCGKKAGHPSEDAVRAEWKSLTPDTRYDIQEMVYKIRHAERTEAVKR